MWLYHVYAIYPALGMPENNPNLYRPGQKKMKIEQNIDETDCLRLQDIQAELTLEKRLAVSLVD
jgi:hypothetical protein